MSEDASGEEVIPAPLPSVSLLNGIPDVVTDQQGLNQAIAALLQGHGPVGVDAERASGFRYGQRAYLVQFYRRDGGTWLIDPIALPDLAPLRDALADCTWILHSAGQDVPCLREVGLDPPHIFDTELAARLLGRDRVGLAPLVESELQHHLAKGHGAADWSTRPIPEDWRRYAALDVEVLPDLYDILHDDLERAGKQEWAAQEAEAVRVAPLPAPRIDPWRRTSGLHKVRGRRGLAIVRALWLSRDLLAQERDISPGRLLPDASIVAAAIAAPATQDALGGLPEFRRPSIARRLPRWWSAVSEGLGEAEARLPLVALPADGPPPPRLWRDRNPEAADRLQRAKETLTTIATEVGMPLENLLTPDFVRRLAWSPPQPVDPDAVAAELASRGARPWQIDLVAEPLAGALAE